MSNPAPVDSITPRQHRRNMLFLVLAGFFLTNALLAELIGGKLFQIPTGLALLGQANYHVTLSCGLVLWPIVFIMTDIINEYFGRQGVRRLSILGAALIAYAFIGLWITDKIPTVEFSPIRAEAFHNVFIQSQWIIIGSITAFLLAQLVDVTVFWLIRRRTGRGKLWLRATGSTVISQMIDTYVVGFIGLYLPHAMHARWPESFDPAGVPLSTYLEAQTAGYGFKLLVAIGITPLLYVVHAVIDRYLGTEQAQQLIEATASREGAGDSQVMSEQRP